MGIIKYVMTGTINGKRPRGWPRQRCIDIIKSDLEKCAPGTKLDECADRDRWYQIVETAEALNYRS